MSALNIDCGRVDSLKGVTGHDLSEHDLGVFARLLAIYLSHDEQDRVGIATMASIVADRNATPDEIEAALETIREGLYPTQPIDLGLDGEWEPGENRSGENRASEEMDLQESTFANRLDELMRLKRISQVQLAEAIGVGQPAISMMLARSCRPQRRTVEKLARALGVAPSDLWPDN
jgi:DNA-binding Xre family transcriptional regulator